MGQVRVAVHLQEGVALFLCGELGGHLLGEHFLSLEVTKVDGVLSDGVESGMLKLVHIENQL